MVEPTGITFAPDFGTLYLVDETWTDSLFEVTTSQKTDLGRVLYANSITITPGTVSIMVYDDRIMVHAISKEGADSLNQGEMDRRVTRMEGLSS